jgi:hypothetical protein
MSGGGTSGAVDFPQHIKDTHHLYLHGSTTGGSYQMPLVSLGAVLNAAIGSGGNPYQNFNYTDPETDLALIDSRADETATLIGELNPTEDWVGALQKAAEEVRLCGRLKDISATSMIQTMRGQSSSVMEQAREENKTDIDELVDWPALAQAVHDKFEALGLNDEFDVSGLIEGAMDHATAGLEAAVAAVLAMLDAGILDDVVAGFEEEASLRKAKTMNTFSGHLADANAVHSSAFLIGVGLIEGQHLATVNRFSAELRLQFVQSSINTHGQLLANVFSAAASIANDFGRTKAQNLLNGVNSMVQILGTRVDHETRLLDLHSRVFLHSLDTAFRSAAVAKQSHDSFLARSTENILAQQASRISANMELTQLTTETKRVGFVARSEHEAADLDLNEKYALWDFMAFEKAANILSAPSGMAAPLPPKQSRAGSALSGAMGGAALGAKFGPYGAAAGGILGGIGGLLS